MFGDLVDGEDCRVVRPRHRLDSEHMIEVTMGDVDGIDPRLLVLRCGTSRISLEPRIDQQCGSIVESQSKRRMSEPRHVYTSNVHGHLSSEPNANLTDSRHSA